MIERWLGGRSQWVPWSHLYQGGKLAAEFTFSNRVVFFHCVCVCVCVWMCQLLSTSASRGTLILSLAQAPKMCIKFKEAPTVTLLIADRRSALEKKRATCAAVWRGYVAVGGVFRVTQLSKGAAGCVCVWGGGGFFFFFFFGWFAWSPRRIKTGDGALRDALTKKKKNVCVLEVLEVCVWARYKKRSQTLWHLRREEVWQCWSNSSGESGHCPPPLHRRQHCVCVLHYVYTSTWALSYTLHPFRFDQLCLHEPSQRSGLFNFTASPVCRGVLGGGVRARAIVRARACVRQLAAASFSACCCCCCWSFSPAPGHGDRGNPGFGVWSARQ